MTIAQLPVAPRPRPGEAPSSWIRRIAARYDLQSDDLVRHLLGQRSPILGRVERFDSHSDPELEDALAAAASISRARIESLRIVTDDAAAWCWHRVRPAWCPRCVCNDLRRYVETYERASWRLGCSVVCPAHGLPLQDNCAHCGGDTRCHYRWAGGLVELGCDRCRRVPGPVLRPEPQRMVDCEGAFGIQMTPGLAILVTRLQADLLRAFRGRPPQHEWSALQTGTGLIAVVRDLTESLVWLTGVRVDLPISWDIAAREPRSTRMMHGVITPAALPVYAARGALAIVAAVIQSGASERAEIAPVWRWREVNRSLSLDMFAACLPVSGRRWLETRVVYWEGAAERLRTALRRVETAA